MEQRNIRPYNGQTYSIEEGADIVDELDKRTKHDDPKLNSVQLLAEAVIQLGQITTQEITTGGNYTDLEVTGNLLIFKNENAQAIINGLYGQKIIEIHNVSTTQDLRLNSMSSSVSGLGKPILAPINTVIAGKGGTARLVYNETEEHYVLVDIWASKTRPEFPNNPTNKAMLVDENSEAFLEEVIELRVFRDVQNSDMTKAELNTDYPDAVRGFEVVCKLINKTYMKVDNNTNDWVVIENTSVL